MLKIDYKLDNNDYLLFNEYHLLNSAAGKKTLLTFRLLMPIMSLLAVFIFYIAGAGTRFILIEAAALIIASIVWIALSKKLMLSSMKRNIERLGKQGKMPFSEEGTLIFDDECVSDINPTSEVKTKYAMIEKFCITEKAFYLYFSSLQAYIVPTSAFLTDADKQSFIDFINSKIPENLRGE